jgi:XTP/dITP diphosphohydrolase
VCPSFAWVCAQQSKYELYIDAGTAWSGENHGLIVAVKCYDLQNFPTRLKIFKKIKQKPPIHMTQSGTLLIATSNRGKLKEFNEILSTFPIGLLNLTDFPGVAPVSEDGKTFAENALLKARDYAGQAGIVTLADDSGLEVVALGGAPGIHSARYAGVNAPDLERNKKLLDALSLVKDDERTARFVCALALVDGSGTVLFQTTGTCEGSITTHPRGVNGFGYDPLFVPSGYVQTFGELDQSVKDQISHRGKALKSMCQYIAENLDHLR